MNVMPEIADAHTKLTEWRRDLHRHPELAFEEHRTSAFVADQLRAFGLQVTTGIAGNRGRWDAEPRRRQPGYRASR